MTDKPHDPKSRTPAPAPEKVANPAEHVEHLDGPKSGDAMHKTEATDKHPQGKTRHGGRAG